MLSEAELNKEGLAKLIPNRKAASGKGRRPTIHTKELGGPRRRGKRELDQDQDDLEDDRPHVGKCLDEEVDEED